MVPYDATPDTKILNFAARVKMWDVEAKATACCKIDLMKESSLAFMFELTGIGKTIEKMLVEPFEKKKEVKKKPPAPSATATDAPAPAVAKADLTFVHDIKFNLRYRFTGFLHHFLKLQYAAVAMQISSIDAPRNSTAVLLDQKTAMRRLTVQIPQKDRITTCHATRLLLKAQDFEITAAIPGDQWTNYKFTLDKAKQQKTLTITTLLNTYFGIGKDALGGFLDLVGIAALQKFEVEVGRVKKPPFANTGK